MRLCLDIRYPAMLKVSNYCLLHLCGRIVSISRYRNRRQEKAIDLFKYKGRSFDKSDWILIFSPDIIHLVDLR